MHKKSPSVVLYGRVAGARGSAEDSWFGSFDFESLEAVLNSG